MVRMLNVVYYYYTRSDYSNSSTMPMVFMHAQYIIGIVTFQKALFGWISCSKYSCCFLCYYYTLVFSYPVACGSTKRHGRGDEFSTILRYTTYFLHDCLQQTIPTLQPPVVPNYSYDAQTYGE